MIIKYLLFRVTPVYNRAEMEWFILEHQFENIFKLLNQVRQGIIFLQYENCFSNSLLYSSCWQRQHLPTKGPRTTNRSRVTIPPNVPTRTLPLAPATTLRKRR